MNTAIAVCDGKISSSLGITKEFVLLNNDSEEQIPCHEKIPVFLKRHNIRILICNKIGNCMLDLLNTMGIKVIPGIEGSWNEAANLFRTGRLSAGDKYSCADHGLSCGACAGTF